MRRVEGFLAADVARDGWAWAQWGLSILAGITGFVVFVPWALERRRRPETRFQWKVSQSGNAADLVLWDAVDAPEVPANQIVLLEAAIQNVGDRPGEDGLINFVVPDCLRLVSVNNPDRKVIVSTNPTAGLPPEHRVHFFAPTTGPWSPGDWVSLHYSLEHVDPDQLRKPLRIRLLFSVSDTRFNESGRRWLPSLVRHFDIESAPAGRPWPPGSETSAWRRFRRYIRWVRPMPRGRVYCTRGERSDTRDIIFMPVQP
jgi:hypothetical protein